MVSGNVPRQYWNSITQNGPWHSFGQLAYDQNDSDYTIGYSSENVSNLLEKKPTNQQKTDAVLAFLRRDISKRSWRHAIYKTLCVFFYKDIQIGTSRAKGYKADQK